LANLVQFVDSSTATSLGLEEVKYLVGEFAMLMQTTCDVKSSNLVVSGEFLIDLLVTVYAFTMVLSKVILNWYCKL